MNYPDGLFPDLWAYGAFVVLTFVWLWAIRLAPWRRLADGGQLNVWLGALVVLSLMWSLKAGVKPGLSLHLLGVTSLTLMFGRALAILGFSLVLLAVTFNGALMHGGNGWQSYALNLLTLAIFPVFVSHAIWRLTERFLPAHFFIYIFVTVFFGAALTMVLTGLFASTLLWLAGAYDWTYLMEDYFPYFLLLAFSEAWLNGAAMTLMVVYFPHWVASFDDQRYLAKK